MSWGLEIYNADSTRQLIMDRRFQKLVYSQIIRFTYDNSEAFDKYLRIYCPGYEPNTDRWRVDSVEDGQTGYVGGRTYTTSHTILEYNPGNIYINYNTRGFTGEKGAGNIGSAGQITIQFWRF